MISLSQLEVYTNDLVNATKTVANHCRDAGVDSTIHLTVPEDMPEVRRARREILANVARLQTLMAEPDDFIQHLASHNQLLACLQWLGEFQVLACIPLNGSVPLKDVADLAHVPETQLCRIVRMTATAGFLHEPQPGYVAHTALSASFVVRLSNLDAVMFLAQTAAPTALQMPAVTKRQGHSDSSSGSAYSLAFNTSQTFQSACEQRSKLQRQWAAYLRSTGDKGDSVTELLSRLDWRNLGSACIVDVSPAVARTDTVVALAERYPALHFILQMSEPVSINDSVLVGRVNELRSRITIQKRIAGTPQPIKNAAVYILRVPTSSSGGQFQSLPARISAELRAHLGILHANTAVTLILAPGLLPEPGTVDSEVDAMARLHDLSILQLTDECAMEMGEVVELVNEIHDSMGRLVVVNQLRSRNSATVALGVKYQAYAENQK
ncbi:MAG: hypothetical protein Q9195_005025 [Heterodermia aff. obscurata]